jgi:hypothetical protein
MVILSIDCKGFTCSTAYIPMAAKYSALQLVNIGRQLGKSPCLNSQAWGRIKSLGLCQSIRGVRAGVKKQRDITCWITSRIDVPKQYSSSINVNNIIAIQPCAPTQSDRIPTIVTSQQAPPPSQETGCNVDNLCRIVFSNNPLLRFALLNARSVCNKSNILCEYIKDKNLDVFGVMKTWLKCYS